MNFLHYKIIGAPKKFKHQPRPLLRSSSLKFGQNFWNLSHDTVPLSAANFQIQTNFSRARNHVLGKKYLNSLMGIRDPGWKNSDPRSGINIPEILYFEELGVVSRRLEAFLDLQRLHRGQARHEKVFFIIVM
jgi:hypothetical protein